MFLFVHEIRLCKLFFFFIFFSVLHTSCKKTDKQTKYYSLEDFTSVAKTDIHLHINGNEQAVVSQLLADNFKALTINTDYPDFIPFQQQQALAVMLQKKYTGAILFAGTFKVASYEKENWENDVIRQIDNVTGAGAVAIKIWKNIGMSDKGANEKLIMIDDPRFDKVYNHLAEKHIPLFIHVGEPQNCWKSIDEMTVNNDKIYFKNHPDYYMYLHPDLPSYQEYIDRRDSVLQQHPNLMVIGCHLGSLEWSVEELALRLERYPNFSVDLAARMGQIQYQAINNREKVRNFFIRYQDRILYGSDISASAADDPKKIRECLHTMWTEDWKFLCSDEKMTSANVDGHFQGLMLPKTVIDKIYKLNAVRYFSGLSSAKHNS